MTPEILAKRKEIERLSKLSDRLQRDLNQIKTVAEGWKQEVAGWLSQAHEYGLTNYIPNSTDEFARQVDELRVISQKRITDVSVSLSMLQICPRILQHCGKKNSKSPANYFPPGNAIQTCFN